MSVLKILSSVLLGMALFGVSAGVFAEKVQLPDGLHHANKAVGDTMKGVHRVVDQGIHHLDHGARYVGDATNRGAKKLDHGMRNGAKKLDHGMRNGAKKLDRGVKHGAQDVGRAGEHGVRDVAHGVKHGAQDLDHVVTGQ